MIRHVLIVLAQYVLYSCICIANSAANDLVSITARFVPFNDSERQRELFTRLATIGRPEIVEMRPGQTLDALVKKRCGFVTPEILTVVRHVNALAQEKTGEA